MKGWIGVRPGSFARWYVPHALRFQWVVGGGRIVSHAATKHGEHKKVQTEREAIEEETKRVKQQANVKVTAAVEASPSSVSAVATPSRKRPRRGDA